MTKRETFHKSGLGHFKKGTVAKKKVVEFQNFATEQKLGDLIDVTMFVEFVDVQGVSKGKGFQGCETSRFWWCWSSNSWST
jgi:ribosomal protein L3